MSVNDIFPLELALEGGLLALVAFGAVVLAAWRALRRSRDDPIGAVLYAGGFAFLVFTPVYVNFRLFPGALLFWMFVGISARSAVRWAGPGSGSDRRSPVASGAN